MKYDHSSAVYGAYNVMGYSPSATSYVGKLDVAAQGGALSLEWTFSANRYQPSEMSGVGFWVGGALIAARGIADGSTNPQTGVVVYDITQRGSLPAQWYHVDLAGRLGHGLSSGGPIHSLAGTYVAEYGTGEEDFTPLRKELRQVGDRFHFAWLRGDDLIYVGIGFVIDKKLVCGWATPRTCIDVLVYQHDQGSKQLHARWASLSQTKNGRGEEDAFPI